MHYENMGILLTNQCTAKCDICCFSCSPTQKEWLPFDKVIEYIRQADKISEITQIGFSGGEPFLDFSSLLTYVKEVKKGGKICSITSNAFWAVTYEGAYQKLEMLKAAGLNGIGLSCDEYHYDFVPIQNIINVIMAAKNLKLTVALQCVITASSNLSNIFGILGPHLADVQVAFIPCYPVGYAEYTIEGLNYIREYDCTNSYCRKSGTFSIDCNGNIWPCCSPYVFKTKLSVGNIFDIDLEEAYDRLRRNIFLASLREYGFDYFLNIADRVGINYPSKVISSCELCALLFNSNNYFKLLPYMKRQKM
ncbi:MAG: radical SAM protein [Eubacteriales bacterium]|nr:radical SAM protein [Eubacteriales bacterium]